MSTGVDDRPRLNGVVPEGRVRCPNCSGNYLPRSMKRHAARCPSKPADSVEARIAAKKREILAELEAAITEGPAMERDAEIAVWQEQLLGKLRAYRTVEELSRG